MACFDLFLKTNPADLGRLVLRIATDDSKAVCRLSVKFGVPVKACRGLLERAKALGLDVVGVSFHVGSGCTDPKAYTQAIADARCVFDIGVSLRSPPPPPHSRRLHPFLQANQQLFLPRPAERAGLPDGPAGHRRRLPRFRRC